MEAEEVAFAPWTFTLKADGAKVTGTVSQGGASGGTTTSLTGATAIYDGAISGKQCHLQVRQSGWRPHYRFFGGDDRRHHRLHTRGEGSARRLSRMNGVYGASGAANFTAKRVLASTAAAPATAEAAPRPAAGSIGAASADLRVVFLGTGTPVPDPDRSGPAVAVVAGTQAYLVDAGPAWCAARARPPTGRRSMRCARHLSHSSS